jgi:hypothetical protein
MKRAGRVWQLLAAVYLVCIWVDGIGCSAPYKILPGTLSYFVGIAQLFPKAAAATIEYRVEGWVCKDKRWEELDYRPYFPLHADDKENRFHRIMYFYRKDKDTMEFLDDYFVAQHNAGRHTDGITSGHAIGGVRLVSPRIPLPKPGDELSRFRHRALFEYPKSYRHTVFHTEKTDLDQRCGESDTPEQETSEPFFKTSEF